MLFNSHLFILLFLPLTCFLHDLVKENPQRRSLMLLGMSLLFYLYWNPWHTALLVASLVINWFLGEEIAKRQNKIWIWLGMCFNLSFLGMFKYIDFASENLNRWLGLELPQLGWILPLGISFYTFQQMSYLLDLHSGLLKERTAHIFFTYICFFPQLIAGPIVRYQDLQKPLSSPWGNEEQQLLRCKGLFIFSLGLSKKLIIADAIAPFVDTAHKALEQGHQPALLEAWLITLAYPFQLYFDFSGYSDMAVGLALMFGIHITQNFNSPFHALNMSDFWQRWHISLSQCFQRYLFNPLAMSLRHHNNFWIKQIFPFLFTMTLIGFWHGAGWTYIIWGFCHGCFLAIAYLCKVWSKRLPKWPPFLSWGLTFSAVMLVFIWFRASSIPSALELFQGCFGYNGLVLPPQMNIEAGDWIITSYYIFPSLYDYKTIEPLLALVPAWLIYSFAPNSIQWAKNFQLKFRYTMFTAALLVISILNINKVSTFLYYQF